MVEHIFFRFQYVFTINNLNSIAISQMKIIIFVEHITMNILINSCINISIKVYDKATVNIGYVK